jgi:muramoyltetrapeptide carboxypeptidase LdcA involved in peptidoglycan recycling
MFQPRDFKKPSNKRTHVLDCELLAQSMTMHPKTTHHRLVVPPKAQPGDRVAVVSPSWAGPGVFPAVHEISMRVLREELGLIPVEYPTTRQRGATPRERAADLMAAFADPTIRAVLATIGGDDQITVLPHLDPAVFIANLKPFVGYSDNTNLLNWLWNLGIVGYHGGSTMVHLARAGGTHATSMSSLKNALFTNDEVEISPVGEFTDLHPDWADLGTLSKPLATSREPGWEWHNANQVISAPTWGGNLEILHWNLATNRWIRPVEDYAGCVLLLETSEEMPSSDEVFRMLRNAGERGLLAQFPAIVVAKPKAWSTANPLTQDLRTKYRDEQRDAIVRVTQTYNPTAMLVFGPDFGHTDPQYILPFGGLMTVDGPKRRISAAY